MGLRLRDFESTPEILPPIGGQVAFQFRAQSSGNPSQVQARISIPEGEPYLFSAAEGGNPREIFLPARGPVAAPTRLTRLGPKRTTIVPDGEYDPARTVPLKIDLALQGFDGSGSAVGSPRRASLLITMDTLGMILELAQRTLGITQREMGQALGVHPGTIGRVMRGGSSPKARAKLESMLRGG